MIKLKYYVLLPNIDTHNYKFNIFNSVRFCSCLMDLKARAKKDDTVDLKEEIRCALSYSYRCKTEYEILIKELFKDDMYKIDIYTQVMLNFDLFYEYLISNWKHIPAKTYRQQSNQKKNELLEEEE